MDSSEFLESILLSVKKSLGLPDDYTPFDPDVVMHINSAFFTLNQLGVGTASVFSIEDSESKWTDFVEDAMIGSVRQYVFLKVRTLFDPPSNSITMEAFNSQLRELEWRMTVFVEDREED